MSNYPKVRLGLCQFTGRTCGGLTLSPIRLCIASSGSVRLSTGGELGGNAASKLGDIAAAACRCGGGRLSSASKRAVASASH